MPLTPEQQAEADKLGIPYDKYEASIAEMIAALSAAIASFDAPGGINTAEGKAALTAGIADSIGNINPLTMLGLDLTVQNPIILTKSDGTQTFINQSNPTQDLSSQTAIDKLMKDVTNIEYLDLTFNKPTFSYIKNNENDEKNAINSLLITSIREYNNTNNMTIFNKKRINKSY